MKLYVLLFTFLFGMGSNAQIINIPDANFKDALVNSICADLDGNGHLDGDADTNDDGEISVSEAQNVFYLNVDDKGIVSLEGLQYFIHLLRFSCNNNQIITLDVSALQYLQSLGCYNNKITSLNLGNNTRLKSLSCSRNNLTSIDVSQCVNLERLYALNNELTQLNVSGLPKLDDLNVQINELTSLDVSQNPLLDSLNCGDNQLSSLDISQNPLIDWLVCKGNILETLDLRNGTNSILVTLQAENNPFLECILVDDENASRPECDPQWNEGWCVDANVRFSEDCLLGTDEVSRIAFSVFPNPANNFLNINASQKIDQVKIYSLQGRLLIESSEPTLEISNLSSGTYLVKAWINGNSSAKMFIKE